VSNAATASFVAHPRLFPPAAVLRCLRNRPGMHCQRIAVMSPGRDPATFRSLRAVAMSEARAPRVLARDWLVEAWYGGSQCAQPAQCRRARGGAAYSGKTARQAECWECRKPYMRRPPPIKEMSQCRWFCAARPTGPGCQGRAGSQCRYMPWHR